MTEFLSDGFLTGCFVFLLGIIAGSFLNVCIYRMPLGESIVSPGSHCTACGKPVAWYDNVPLLSYLILGAKCRNCKVSISARYFVVELLCGLIWLGLWKTFATLPLFAAAAAFFSILLAVTVIDFETGLIPDALSYPGMILGIIFSALVPELQGQSDWIRGLISSLIGLFGGGAILYLTAVIGDYLFKKDTMGGGDIKLLAMAGAFLGLKKAAFIFFLAPLPALPLALYVKYFKKKETIPYGPFLALTAAIFFIAGDSIISFLGF